MCKFDMYAGIELAYRDGKCHLLPSLPVEELQIQFVFADSTGMATFITFYGQWIS